MTISVEEAYATGDFVELAFSFAPVGIVVTENRVIRDCNDTFAEMFRYERAALKEMVGPGVMAVAIPLAVGILLGVETLGGLLAGALISGVPLALLQRAVWSFADISDTRPYQALTRREREVFSLLAEGLTSKEIAIKLEMSNRTVEVHRGKLLKKFGVSNTASLFQSLGAIGTRHIYSASDGTVR